MGTSYFTTRELESTTQGPGNARPVYEEHIITKGYSVVFQPGVGSCKAQSLFIPTHIENHTNMAGGKKLAYEDDEKSFEIVSQKYIEEFQRTFFPMLYDLCLVISASTHPQGVTANRQNGCLSIPHLSPPQKTSEPS